MFGFAVMSPWPSRGSSSEETVGWASNSLWSGLGKPYAVGSAAEATPSARIAKNRCTASGVIDVIGFESSSIGLPLMYLGMT